MPGFYSDHCRFGVHRLLVTKGNAGILQIKHLPICLYVSMHNSPTSTLGQRDASHKFTTKQSTR